MDVWITLGNGEPSNVGSAHATTTVGLQEAVADLLVAVAETLKAGAPVLDLPGDGR